MRNPDIGVYIPTANGEHQVLVDHETYLGLLELGRNLYIWGGYPIIAVRRDGKGYTLYLHRVVMNAIGDAEVDHINNDRLDCRQSNLRLCTHTQNSRNLPKYEKGGAGRTRFKGVRKMKLRTGVAWQAYTSKDGKFVHLGLFKSELEAAKVYDGAVVERFGEFAKTNAMLGLL